MQLQDKSSMNYSFFSLLLRYHLSEMRGKRIKLLLEAKGKSLGTIYHHYYYHYYYYYYNFHLSLPLPISRFFKAVWCLQNGP